MLGLVCLRWGCRRPRIRWDTRTPILIHYNCEFVTHTKPEADLKMVGMSRVVTDYTTFGYLTDVYVLKEHQGQGLAKWMMECLNEVLNEWPDFRRLLLVTSNDFAIPLYRKTLGAEEWSKADVGTMKVLVKRGRAATKNVS